MKNKRSYFWDLDGTLVDSKNSPPPRREDFLTAEAFGQAENIFWNHDRIGALPPVLNGVEALRWLVTRAPGEVIFLTARDERCREATAAWLQRILPEFSHDEAHLRMFDSSDAGIALACAFKRYTVRMHFAEHRPSSMVVVDDKPEILEAVTFPVTSSVRSPVTINGATLAELWQVPPFREIVLAMVVSNANSPGARGALTYVENLFKDKQVQARENSNSNKVRTAD